ncbi:MAG: CDP-alcohol phosphatidyltransferase [Candidatus Mcinerneyibacterium aminivorans]|uniref:CDP-alcohol phosphatidyltransferase n=1 Tax=Candidatus Mcinerneyibacterium aminivorans TaxID=2703815 RepID=A0A5D0MHF7_9BACT|nr:MAG: CDP-alcohol phosphatidyltransferase [Candidatus Mcinerneyibacterium aminivorans]
MSEKEEKGRIYGSLLQPMEKKLLIWIVKRLPKSILPDHMTNLGFAGAVIIFIGYILTNISPIYFWLATFGFIVNWFGDSLDGNIARYRNIQRPKYGFYIDHNVDAITVFFIGIGAGFSPFIQMYVAFYVVISYFLISIHTYINMYIQDFFKLSYGKFGPTETRLIMMIFNTIFFFLKAPPMVNIFGYSFTYFDLMGIGLGTIIFILYIFSYFKNLKKMARVDPPDYD